MKKLMHFLLLSCAKATELIEKKMYFKLGFKEKIQLKAHKTMCSACTLYEKQSELLDKALKSTPGEKNITLDIDELKKNTIEKIRKAQ